MHNARELNLRRIENMFAIKEIYKFHWKKNPRSVDRLTNKYLAFIPSSYKFPIKLIGKFDRDVFSFINSDCIVDLFSIFNSRGRCLKKKKGGKKSIRDVCKVSSKCNFSHFCLSDLRKITISSKRLRIADTTAIRRGVVRTCESGFPFISVGGAGRLALAF